MRRTTTLTAAALLGLALLAPAYSATAAGETCRGEAATIVGTQPTLTGTEGRDVIVTGTAGDVDARGGDDLICVSRSVRSADLLDVDAGDGNDFVDASAVATGYSGRITLGPGADAFTGGAADDVVYTGAPGSDADPDSVFTWEGDDHVFSGSSGVANRDVVSLGTDDDSLQLASAELATGGIMAGGDGHDDLRLATGTGEVVLDQAAGTLTTAVGTATVAAFEDVTVDAGPGKLTYRGTRGDDSLTVHPDGAPVLDVATDRGDDLVVVEPAVIARGSRIDTDRGADRLVAAKRDGSLELNLGFYHRFVIDGEKVADVAGIDDAFLLAPEVTLVGSNADNNLVFAGCTADLKGGHGRDTLANGYDSWFESYIFDCAARASMDGGPDKDRLRGGQGRDRLRGQGGNDTLEGRGGNDVLLGGGGRDKADGGKGRDRCTAEREKSCER